MISELWKEKARRFSHPRMDKSQRSGLWRTVFRRVFIFSFLPSWVSKDFNRFCLDSKRWFIYLRAFSITQSIFQGR